jgi:phosphoribosylanthranilate isomerase
VSEEVAVKICGITSESDALLCVGLGAKALGFLLAPSPRQVPISLVRNIVHRVPREVMTVGVFRNEAPQRVVQLAHEAGLSAVQLHGLETAADTRYVAERVPCTIKAFSAGESAITRFEEFGADYIMIDGPSPGSGQVFDWRLAEGVIDRHRLFLSGGLHAGNVGDAIARLAPFAVDVATGVESEPGVKDPNKVRAFMVAVEEACLARDTQRQDEAPPEAAGVPYDWMGE